MKYLLDSNTISRLFGSRMSPDVSGRFRAAMGEIAIAAVVWNELLFGVERMPPGRRRDQLNDFFRSVVRPACPVLPYDEAAAVWHAREHARLERIGRPAPFQDGQIAATASTNGLTLVTANVRDFRNFEGLIIEDWSTPGP